MALVLDESFLTGIPGGFATARAQAGTLSATYNVGAKAVDLSNATAGQNIWDITSQALSAAGEFELDLEFVSNASGTLGFGGAWAVSGQAAVSNGFRFAHNSTNYEVMPWTGAGSWSGNGAADAFAQAGTLPFATAGDRRVFNVRWDMSAGAGQTRLAAEFRLDGNLILKSLLPYPSLRPGITLYQSTVRLHSIKVWDAPQAPLTPISSRGLPTPIARRICAPARALSPGGPVTVAFSDKVARRNIYQGGVGRINGTVKEKSLPANVPLHRRVCLLEEKTRLLVAETWSDATTGNYVFERIDQTRTYTVMAYDHTGTYRAVVADNIIPDPL